MVKNTMTESTKTYEMLWDCEYCDTKKLLGKTHRHCPECGAVQNAERRYFPEEHEKVAVEDHQFVGADKHCPACNAPNSALTKFCTECGSPMSEGASVRGVAEAPAVPPPPRSKAKSGGSRKAVIIAGAVIAVVAAAAVLLLWKKEVALTVTGHTWQRQVYVETYTALKERAWCDQLPTGAYSVTRTREVRSHKKIPDGETCTTKRVDNKDGTFSERQDCKPKYRKEPVYDDNCSFTINRWHESRSIDTAGKSLQEPPVWPTVNLPPSPAAVLGAERAGRRVEKYSVHFADKKETYTCDFNEAQWRSFGMGTPWKGESGALTDILDCSSLAPMK